MNMMATTHTIEESTAPDGYFMVQVPADNNFDMFIYADGYWAELSMMRFTYLLEIITL